VAEAAQRSNLAAQERVWIPTASSNGPNNRGFHLPHSGSLPPVRRISGSSASILGSASKRAAFPKPVPTEAGSMPPRERLGSMIVMASKDRRKPSIQHDQEQAIPVRELDATAHLPLQHDYLMSDAAFSASVGSST
jgi:hypothetical protein